MNRDRLVGKLGGLDCMALITQAAFHEAGHAAAIYFRNRYHNLPPVNFHISLLGVKQAKSPEHRQISSISQVFQTKLEGGLLVNNPALNEKERVPAQAAVAYRQACEADVVNLLAGPLAEAKHIAQRDGEHFNHHLVDFDALKNYGGIADQKKVEEYLDGFGLPPINKALKLRELHTASFHFIEQAHHWRAITHLAQHILNSDKEIIACEESIAILDAAMAMS